MLTNVVDCPPEEIRVGMLVEVAFLDVDGDLLPIRPSRSSKSWDCLTDGRLRHGSGACAGPQSRGSVGE